MVFVGTPIRDPEEEEVEGLAGVMVGLDDLGHVLRRQSGSEGSEVRIRSPLSTGEDVGDAGHEGREVATKEKSTGGRR